MRRALLPLLFLSAVGVACGGGSDSDDGAEAVAAADLSSGKVAIENSATLPINEVSGLGVRTVSGKPQYMAIGDSSTTLVTFDVGADGKPTRVKSNDLSSIFPDSDSQWEAVAGDASGHVFIESEGEATISVLSANLELQHLIHLTVPPDNPLFASWDRDDNSRGEGMLLLSNGHIIIAKEKGPPALMEFAPKGEPAAGYAPALALKGAFKFPSGSESEFVAVKNWELKSSVARLIGDISDLTLDADGAIMLLSDQSRAIARIEKELSVDEDKIDLKAIWDLPHAIEKPEGLQLINGKPIVGCDLKKVTDTSFFSISAL